MAVKGGPRIVVIAGVLLGCGATPSEPPPPTTHATPAPVAASAPSPAAPPTTWPAGFPTVEGGRAETPPPMGPVRVGLLAYEGRAPDALASAYRALLEAGGWSIEEGASTDDARRFVAAHGEESVTVSIYRDGAATLVQTMQLATPEASETTESER